MNEYAVDATEVVLTRAQSLGVFFEDLGLKGFIDGPPVGGFLDWGPVTSRQLDELVQRESKQSWHEYRHNLLHIPDPNAGKSGARQPYFQDSRGRGYLFRSARFEDGQFLLTAVVQEPGQAPVELELPLSAFRERIGVPVSPEPEKPGYLRQIVKFLFG